MDNKSMHNQSANGHVIHNTNQQQPITISSNLSRSPDIQCYNERPMMLNTWTQTSNAELGIGDDYLQNKHFEQYKQREKALLQEIHNLRAELNRSDLLAQSSSGCSNSSRFQKTQSPREVIVKQMPAKQQQQECIQSGRPRKVNYKIIADGSVNGHDGPVEIEIAEDENSLDLNASADSGRLEICFAEEQPQSANINCVLVENNTEQNMSKKIPEQNSVMPGPGPSAKRFKMSTGNVSKYPNQNNCESPESTQNVSHYSNTRKSSDSSQSATQYPDSQNCEMSELQSMAANNNNSNFRPNGGEINNQHQERSAALLGMMNSYTSIGPNNTRVPTKIFDGINWDNPSMATRKLMMAIFTRETLATHSMTGKPSPAFKGQNKPLKKMLNPLMTQDIIFAVSRRCKVPEKEVRNAITTKCADENKMWKLAKAKAEQNKENVA